MQSKINPSIANVVRSFTGTCAIGNAALLASTLVTVTDTPPVAGIAADETAAGIPTQLKPLGAAACDRSCTEHVAPTGTRTAVASERLVSLVKVIV